MKRLLLLKGLAETTPRAAIEKARSEGMLPEELRYISQVVNDSDGRDALFQAIDEIENTTEREGFYWSYVDRLQDAEGFDGAREFVEDAIGRLGDDQWNDEMVMKVALNHVTDQPKEKAAWLAKFLSPEKRTEKLAEFVDAWALKDPESAAAWLESQESTEFSNNL